MPDLPIYPDRGRETPGHRLERRRQALEGVTARAREEAFRGIRLECAFETLRLTGAPVARDLVYRVASGAEAGAAEDEEVVRAVLQGLDRVEREAGRRSDLDLDLVRDVHRTANPSEDGALRTSDRGSQFQGGRPSPPRFLEPKLENLLEWLSAESSRSMFPAERMTLWFARFVEIAPFERGNFRTAHLLASFYAVSEGFPPVTFKLEEADAIRTDVERAIRFDTLPLVERFSEAISRSLAAVEEASGLDSPEA